MVEVLSLLAAAVVAVLIFTRLGLGPVLGYLAAGAIIGPFGIGLVSDAEKLRHIGEFGVIFLLFMIGLEMKPRRLWIMRKLVFGLGGLQVLISGIVMSAIAHWGFAMAFETSLVIGFGLSLSSTAFGVQLLSQRNEMTSQHGRNSFAILLFQDLAVVPMMILLPLLAIGEVTVSSTMGTSVLKAVGIVVGVLVVGRYAMGPIMHVVAKLGLSDTFVATALLLVLGFSWLMEQAGLSMAMGAFIAGVLLADSEYRHQIEADILPFRGLLLGLFFMSVGMSLDPTPVINNVAFIAMSTFGLLACKALIVVLISLFWKISLPSAIRSGFLLSQSGEFGFVLFSLAASFGLLGGGVLDELVSVVVLSMLLTPAMVWLGNKCADHFEEIEQGAVDADIAVETAPVLIAGFGRVGETVANMLEAAEVPYVAIDADASRVARARQLGYHVYFGSAGRPEVLKSVGAQHARLIVVTLDDPKVAEALVSTARRQCPNVPIHVRARDWEGADAFSAMGADHAMPETVEASLRLGAAALEAAGVDSERRCALFEELSAENFAKMRGFNRTG